MWSIFLTISNILAGITWSHAVTIIPSTMNGMEPDSALIYFTRGIEHLDATQYKDALACLNKARDLVNIQPSPTHDTLQCQIYKYLGKTWCIMNEVDSCIVYQKQLIHCLGGVYGPQNAQMAMALNNYAGIFAGRGEVITALSMRREALDMVWGQENRYPKLTAILCGNLAELYEGEGNFDQAIVYGRFAYSYILQSTATAFEKATIADNLGRYLCFKRQFEEAGKFMNESEKIMSGAGVSQKSLWHLQHLNEVAALARAQGQYSTALAYDTERLDLLEKDSNNGNSAKAHQYNNLGLDWFALLNDDSCMAALQKSTDFVLANNGSPVNILTRNFRMMGDCRARQNALAQARTFYYQALEVNKLSDEGPITRAALWHEAFQTYASLAKLEAQEGNLEKAIEYCFKADSALGVYRTRLPGEGARMLTAEKTLPFYVEAFRIAYQLWTQTAARKWAEAAFVFSEKSKGWQLHESIKESDALHFAGVDSSDINKTYFFRDTISRLEQERASLYLDKGKQAKIDSTLIALNRQQDEFHQYLGQKNNRYLEYKFDLKSLDLTTLQQQLLSPQQVMLEYVIGDSVSYLMAISPQKFNIIPLPIGAFSLEKKITGLRQSIITPHTQRLSDAGFQSLRQQFAQYAFELYQILLAPVGPLLAKEIIVIPDGPLAFLPFETLIPQQPANPMAIKSYPFIIHNFHISYSYSANLLSQMKKQPHYPADRNHLFLGMAPTFSGEKATIPSSWISPRSNQLAALKNNVKETSAIQQVWGGWMLSGEDAIKDSFFVHAPFFNIIHLSTHSKADNISGAHSFLAFYSKDDRDSSSSRLYAWELLSLRINASLVTLSACETDMGYYQKGEGILSLTRAFAYAGAKSLVSSLWLVDDENTSGLMVNFYKNLHNKSLKNIALGEAKRTFIREINPDPFFWAGFIQIGDTNPIY